MMIVLFFIYRCFYDHYVDWTVYEENECEKGKKKKKKKKKSKLMPPEFYKVHLNL